MRLLITGANGMLGSEFVKLGLLAGYEVIKLDRSACDITVLQEVVCKIEKAKPDVIIHCAAYTDVDGCELNPEIARLTNGVASGYIAEAAQRFNALVVFISSCGVFSGKKESPYTEDDLPEPITSYARSKIEGEKLVASFSKRHLILRTGWLFGGSSELKKNFVAARKREAEKKAVIQSAIDKYGSPTWTYDFVLKTFELLEQKANGLFHLVNSGVATRFEYVSEIISLFGLSTVVEPVDSSLFLRPAPVPDNESLVSLRLSSLSLAFLRPWQEALSDYIVQFNRTVDSLS